MAQSSFESVHKGLAGVVDTGEHNVNRKKHGLRTDEFREMINHKYGTKLESYLDLHQWSIDNYIQFWEEMWHFSGVISSSPYEIVLKDPSRFIGSEWFVGAKLNYAENILRYRNNSPAVICISEEGYPDRTLTFAELYEEVQLWAAALRAYGLKPGDNVACYLPNLLETVVLILAAISVGGVICGILPFLGPQFTSSILDSTKPKFLFTMDRFIYDKKEYTPGKHLHALLKGADYIKKVIVIPNRDDQLPMDTAKMEKCIFSADFLKCGRNLDGSIPELVFEQLPPNHPIYISFTSGTTGPPKSVIHSCTIFLGHMKDYYFHCGLTTGDRFLNTCPMGWGIFNYFLSSLALGVTFVLFNGEPAFLSKTSIWDVISKYQVTGTLLCTNIIDMMENIQSAPGPGCDLQHFSFALISASPPKDHNIIYLRRCVNSENFFVLPLYGFTETMGSVTAPNINKIPFSPSLLLPVLGYEVKCLDDEGKPVVGQIGEIAITITSPSLPIAITNREGVDASSSCLSKFPGVYCQGDACWIHPETGSIVVVGRSDDTLNPEGVRFGAIEIYDVVLTLDGIEDCLCIGQRNALGDERVVLFLKLEDGYSLSDKLLTQIKEKLTFELTEYHVPAIIMEIPDIPYNYSNKRMERLVKKIIHTNEIPVVSNIKNPDCLSYYCNIPELQGY